jgi:hypothetical protein
MVTNNDMCKIEFLCEILKPFEESTDILQGQLCYRSCALMVFHKIMKALDPELNESSFSFFFT